MGKCICGHRESRHQDNVFLNKRCLARGCSCDKYESTDFGSKEYILKSRPLSEFEELVEENAGLRRQLEEKGEELQLTLTTLNKTEAERFDLQREHNKLLGYMNGPEAMRFEMVKNALKKNATLQFRYERRENLWREYEALLVAELNEVVSLAACHGWKSTRYEDGERLRAVLAEGEEE